ncbi:MAG: CDP-glycerol--glycerophosphate glycerophosphotransferase [Alphaproteobacteria bacterium]|nr:CDP-glycerol--glycerophosphate glycerophosphotransferase [Alphaproteobacteria bacterium]HCP00536.1 CDP-glycerol--glycerophosphate glycerophosphotransferase [Rhodospirillaceae bacterium]
MFDGLRRSMGAWSNARRFVRECTDPRALTIFSEGAVYGSFLNPVISELADVREAPIHYLSADPDDPILAKPPSHILPYYVGGGALIYALTNIRSGTLVTTMPDLNTFHLKRSVHPVHYVYLFHSMVSTHMVYREGAFDYYDSILCVGPHHRKEIRAWEAERGLPEKNLHDHGYGVLDRLMSARASYPGPRFDATAPGGYDLLLAPSWGPDGVLETIGSELVAVLLDAGHRLTVRPHPRTRDLSSDRLEALETKFSSHPGFRMESDTTNFESLHASHLMISDWSGAALEYAFGLERPVLFVDVPRKINNPHWKGIGLDPLEAIYRESVGAILDPSSLKLAPAKVARLCAVSNGFVERIRDYRKRHVYNIGTGDYCAAETISAIAANPVEGLIHSR